MQQQVAAGRRGEQSVSANSRAASDAPTMRSTSLWSAKKSPHHGWLTATFLCARQPARLPFDGTGSRPCCRRGPTSSPALRRSPPKPPTAQTSVFGRDSGISGTAWMYTGRARPTSPQSSARPQSVDPDKALLNCSVGSGRSRTRGLVLRAACAQLAQSNREK